jgi:hypothetical protein
MVLHIQVRYVPHYVGHVHTVGIKIGAICVDSTAVCNFLYKKMVSGCAQFLQTVSNPGLSPLDLYSFMAIEDKKLSGGTQNQASYLARMDSNLLMAKAHCTKDIFGDK